jgi:hypothetical protein
LRDADVSHIHYDELTRWPSDFVPPHIRASLLDEVRRRWAETEGRTTLNLSDIEQVSRSVHLEVPEAKRYLMLLTSTEGPIVGGTIASDESGLIGIVIDKVTP